MTTNETTPGPQRGPASLTKCPLCKSELKVQQGATFEFVCGCIEDACCGVTRECGHAATPPPTADLPTGPGVWVREGETWLVFVRHPNELQASRVVGRGRETWLVHETHFPRGNWQPAVPSGEVEQLRAENERLNQQAKQTIARAITGEGEGNRYGSVTEMLAGSMRNSHDKLEKELEVAQAENAELRRQVEEAKAERERASVIEKAACDCVIDLARAMAGEYPGMGHTECELRMARTAWALSNKLTTAQAELAALRQQLDTYEKALINGGLLIKVRSDTASGPQAMYAIAVSADEFNSPQHKGGE